MLNEDMRCDNISSSCSDVQSVTSQQNSGPLSSLEVEVEQGTDSTVALCVGFVNPTLSDDIINEDGKLILYEFKEL